MSVFSIKAVFQAARSQAMSQSTSGVKVTAKMPLSQSLLVARAQLKFENHNIRRYKEEGHYHELLDVMVSILQKNWFSWLCPLMSRT